MSDFKKTFWPMMCWTWFEAPPSRTWLYVWLGHCFKAVTLSSIGGGRWPSKRTDAVSALRHAIVKVKQRWMGDQKFIISCSSVLRKACKPVVPPAFAVMILSRIAKTQLTLNFLFHVQNWVLILILLDNQDVSCGVRDKIRIAPLSFLHGCRKRRLKD
jgi:hypothetical protein